jgi:dihydrofolate reductase
MSKVCVRSFGVSLDGFGAGPGQDLEHPLGVGGEALFQWFFATRTFCAMLGKPGGTATGADEAFAQRGFENIGAWIIGRNMFGPVRGPWPDESWRGWWGEEPPYHVPVFVLTHHARPPLKMQGGTTFHFVTDGIESALRQARDAAAGKDVRIGGGVSTVRQYLAAGLVDEMHLAVSPVFLGRGENLLAGLDLPEMGFKVAEHVATEACTHVVLTKAAEARG